MDRFERDFGGMVEAKKFANGLGMRIKGKKQITSGSSVFGLSIHGHGWSYSERKDQVWRRERREADQEFCYPCLMALP